ncbi:MAG: M20/M25/M40 family metallo-hydrolase [Pirellulales bacterium]|nr:M20/M25/M40 family metallo-hydrolase [Pirellulales bacterium]
MPQRTARRTTSRTTKKKTTRKSAANGKLDKKPQAKKTPAKKVTKSEDAQNRTALKLVMELMAIPGPSGEERLIVEAIRKKLLAGGAKKSMLSIDDTPKKSPLGGNSGGLILKVPGKRGLPRRLLMAHVDTVPLCVGCKPVRRGDFVVSANKSTALGADDRAGASVVLNAALAVLKSKVDHPPLTFYWPVQEEVGLFGARFISMAKLGNPKLGFNFDGGDYQKLIIGATGAYRLEIEVRGHASHAGMSPERGVSAIAIASLAIADLARGGWHGDIHKNGHHGTSNIGVIQGGAATNVVTDLVKLRAEARSHDPKFRKKILSEMTAAFRRAAKQVANVDGKTGKTQVTSRLDYESFLLGEDDPCVQIGENAVRQAGGTPVCAIANGGVDANWLSARGLPTVTFGCGQINPHMVTEQLDIQQFHHACQVGLSLAFGSQT